MKRSDEAQKAVNEDAGKMSLYQFKRCPFCTKTRRHIHKLNLPIEYRDASRGSPHRDELETQGGKIKVPCLRIDKENDTLWLYESSEIITFLHQKFGKNS